MTKMNSECLGRARINKHSIVGQDFSFFKWDNDNVVFNVFPLSGKKVMCVADGYGGKLYGNGAVYTLLDNLTWMNLKEMSNEELINEMSDHGLPLEYKTELLSRLEQTDFKCCGNCGTLQANANVML